jgi:hypothetical protein
VRAARSAGVSEAVLRRWLTPGMRPVRACGRLQAACTCLLNGEPLHDPRPAPAPSVPVPAQVPVVTAPVAVPLAPSNETIVRWHQVIVRASQVRRTDPMAADRWTQEVARELHQFGLTDLPPVPDRWLPPGLDWTRVATRYVAWCHATGRPGPTDRDVEMHAMSWYRAHVVLSVENR